MAKIIRTEGTPNPNALKFVLDETILYADSRSFNSADEATGDPVALSLFAIDGVTSVFYMKDFITINKVDERPWREIAVRVYEIVPTLDISSLTEAAVRAAAAVNVGAQGEFDRLNDTERLSLINTILDRDIRPGLASDGGGLQVSGIDGYRVSIHYQGACGSCPSSTTGTLRYIDSLLKEKVHAAIEVVPV